MPDGARTEHGRLLIVFAKEPVAGQVKTRIGAVVGTEQAAVIYAAMLEKVVAESSSNDCWQQIIAITPESDEAYFKRAGLEVMRQRGPDLGERLSDALLQGFQRGACQVVIIGSDIPTVTRSEIAGAFLFLNSAPAVIGPSVDGGFYLYGSNAEEYRKSSQVLAGEIHWSTSTVLEEVKGLCQKHSLPLSFLPAKKDIDTYEDWLEYKKLREGNG